MTDTQLKIGVLALQGAVTEHIAQVESLGAIGVAVKRIEQLDDLDGIILPGGESTAIGKLMRHYGFIEALQNFAKKRPLFGTCAGMILLAKNIVGGEPSHLNLMDITVQRNAFGRQVDSFQTELDIKGIKEPIPAVFIRAPYIASVDSSEVEVLATVNEQPVLAKQGNLLACSFHPELTTNTAILKLFLAMI
ncbi:MULTISPECIES: pyridoxal 5'-phosphate synthase glutaminase subunit PdxT [Pasteurellaceae]|uniref:Pyridoxal 5'-phosphate synthase subunit PdxT n=1 Tax=Pasteurella atlantica TaxID=2827233 RepID=A0AAW8CR15_9PAST|nr:pyridoxal 5'-phosphate synthase glutaminase subunit PdxT [Pasteurella atlantica]MBR0573244.1 pyridoxal 5'-phosphate synthase glutaminase subunit PdxT [Pasteurella atlantica]MDP8039140.1 pyridoxal 5'-phosphate synthase glutaminase subunit PdxT [Pasteurella atlantica]MDP8041261.1 pyridoxal 5'-phosphate synthase glutaminase subunit PdxT [Pasteurella atlantica]MDP8043398.1 pyridoxal 5'-phosphate synthase glutaminase subunit PdxT [Pasteurella atlantica]MDP8045484.1 pyridoxal 5'-phosphate synthas